jgi:hypothetical protein
MHIKDLIGKAPRDWGTPEANRANIVKLGVRPLDEAIYGIDIVGGDLLVIQGQEKDRKTTTMLNFVMSIMLCGVLQKLGGVLVIEILESGETIEKCRDKLISMLATFIIIAGPHGFGKDREKWNPQGVFNLEHLGLCPKYLRYANRTRVQQDAIEQAMSIIDGWPLIINGASSDREHRTDTRDIKAAPERWHRQHGMGAKILVVDHMQDYDVPGVPDYMKQEIVVPVLSKFQIDTASALIVLSQVSLGSAKNYKNGAMDSMHPKGGAKLTAESNTTVQVEYDELNRRVKISTPRTRDAKVRFYQHLDITSGLFIGPPVKAQRRQT